MRRFDEAYRLDEGDSEPLGEGTFAVVRVCRSKADNTRWAVKIVDLEKASGNPVVQAKTRASFLREAQTLSRFDHQNLVRVHAYGQLDATKLFMVMDLLPRDCTLHDALNSARRRGRGPSLGTIVRMGLEVGAGLGYAHAQGVIHRDLKPGNIGIDFQRRFRLLDFGLMKQLGEPAEASNGFVEGQNELTVAGWGSYSYGAPEQFFRGEVGPWTDIFSLGAVLYEMIAGRPPTKNRTLQDVLAALDQPPPALPADPRRPEGLDEIVARCLARDIADRPSALGPVLEALGTVWREVDARARAGQVKKASDTLMMAPVVSPEPKVRVIRMTRPEATAAVTPDALNALLRKSVAPDCATPTPLHAPEETPEATMVADETYLASMNEALEVARVTPSPEPPPETVEAGRRVPHWLAYAWRSVGAAARAAWSWLHRVANTPLFPRRPAGDEPLTRSPSHAER